MQRDVKNKHFHWRFQSELNWAGSRATPLHNGAGWAYVYALAHVVFLCRLVACRAFTLRCGFYFFCRGRYGGGARTAKMWNLRIWHGAARLCWVPQGSAQPPRHSQHLFKDKIGLIYIHIAEHSRTHPCASSYILHLKARCFYIKATLSDLTVSKLYECVFCSCISI